MPHLASLRYTPPAGPERLAFPFAVPALRGLGALALGAPVTFFVGENGSGKSTLLEGIATAADLPAVGSASVDDDRTLAEQRRLGRHLALSWHRRTRRGFFLRSEDFFGFAKRVAAMRAEMQQRVAELDVEYAERSDWSRTLAQGPARASIAELEARYGADLDACSHGQSFLRVFQSRFVPGGLYLLDEPEAPLSPQSQLALMSMLLDMVAQDAQFIVATHSPILLALPGARILNFDAAPAAEARYDELEHVSLTRDFLADPGRFLRHLGPGAGDAAH